MPLDTSAWTRIRAVRLDDLETEIAGSPSCRAGRHHAFNDDEPALERFVERPENRDRIRDDIRSKRLPGAGNRPDLELPVRRRENAADIDAGASSGSGLAVGEMDDDSGRAVLEHEQSLRPDPVRLRCDDALDGHRGTNGASAGVADGEQHGPWRRRRRRRRRDGGHLVAVDERARVGGYCPAIVTALRWAMGWPLASGSASGWGSESSLELALGRARGRPGPRIRSHGRGTRSFQSHCCHVDRGVPRR